MCDLSSEDETNSLTYCLAHEPVLLRRPLRRPILQERPLRCDYRAVLSMRHRIHSQHHLGRQGCSFGLWNEQACEHGDLQPVEWKAHAELEEVHLISISNK